MVFDERIKHRLTGLVVILSLAVIFLPVLMKSSNHRLDENIRVSLQLPHKPVLPEVVVPKQEIMFSDLNVAHVDLPKLPIAPNKELVEKAKSLTETVPEKPVQLTKAEVVAIEKVNTPKVIAEPIKHEVKKISTNVQHSPAVAQAQNVKKLLYAVQLASFSQQNNADALVKNLRRHGMTASYQKVSGKNGVYYQVLVGKLPQKNAAINLQKQLASDLRLNGFVVQTAIG